MESWCNPGVVLDRQQHALSVVLVINLAMFLIELGAGLDLAGSGRPPQGGADGGLWGGDPGRGRHETRARGRPWRRAHVRGSGLLALAPNAVVLGLLWRHRADDLNMRSVWLCSRNDVVANVGVLVAALGVRLTDRAWPDIVVGVAIAGLLVMSAAGVIRAALRPAAADRAA